MKEWGYASPHSTFQSTTFCLICLWYLLHIELMVPFLPYQCFLCTVSHETDVVWVQESCRFTAASWHSDMLWTCAEENVWVSRDCFPAPSPKGKRVGPCSNRGVWHVQIHRIWWKECYDAKRAAVTDSSTMCLTCLGLLMGTGSRINLSVLPWNFHTSAGFFFFLPKSEQICFELLNVTVCPIHWHP